ncbi:LacI family transcriptional regulator [Saccharibacillus sp. O23]|uniref:LacI family DNA-binding transcriptional regulator n=1 Tax=Saccharibacillus sp. O23 TaxID=2009338 RepID=UPI000B4E0A48|nr:LacI family DNA-binding transcriptional regulator [Saccharibacillus sp. O23]OWR31113.1 LacI family transcriptional regulator [Saccharibacillus sp. O23]
MKAKLEDVARLAGVSPTTVSRMMNNRGYVSEATKIKVRSAMEELNYFPNDIARSLFNKRTRLIGLILPTTANPFFGELTFHIENLCAAHDLKVLLCNSLNRIDKEEQYAEMLMRNQVDGIIVGTHNRGMLNYRKSNLAVVAIDRYLSDTIPVVGSDNYEGGRLATQRLIDRGCRRILHFNGPAELETPAQLRRKAFEETMERRGLPHRTYEIEQPLDRDDQLAVIRRAFDEHPDADGVFASNDMIAASVIFEAGRRGLSVPGDLKVIGYDGTGVITSAMPQLTTIRQPIEGIARAAIEVLLREIDGEFDAVDRQITLPVELYEGSTA